VAIDQRRRDRLVARRQQRLGRAAICPHSRRARYCQIALTVVLLVCAGLVWKSFATIMRVNPGMHIDNTLSMVISLAPRATIRPRSAASIIGKSGARGRDPRRHGAAFTQTMPFTWGIPANFVIQGSAADDVAKLPPTLYDSVSPTYFQALGIPVLAGRTFAPTDDAAAPRVIILSQSAAAKFFPGEDPLGKRLLVRRPARGKRRRFRSK
jgi:hypothetical protein